MEGTPDDVEKSLKLTPKDRLYGGAKGGISAIPVAGGVLSEIFSQTIESPYEKRRNAIIVRMDKDIQELQKKHGISKDDLLKNEQFLSAVAQALQIAIKTHQEEKLEALKNIVLNVANSIDIDDDLQTILLSIVDELTPTHLAMLRYFYNPREWVEMNNVYCPWSTAGPSNAFFAAFPNLKNSAKPFLKDLMNKNLIPDGEWFNVSMSDYLQPRITDLGKTLLKMISSPV